MAVYFLYMDHFPSQKSEVLASWSRYLFCHEIDYFLSLLNYHYNLDLSYKTGLIYRDIILYFY